MKFWLLCVVCIWFGHLSEKCLLHHCPGFRWLSTKIGVGIAVAKEFQIPYSSWDTFCFHKNITKVSPAPLLRPTGTKHNVSLMKPFSALFKCRAGLAELLQFPEGRKKVGGELVAPWQQCHLHPLPVRSLRAIWWSSCHRRLSVIHFLCPIPEVASAKIHWKIILGW